MLLRVLFLRDCRRFSYYNNFGACFIRNPPTPPSAEQLAEMKVILGSKLEFLGLGSYSPSGLVQLMLNSIHDNFGVPWWASIFLFMIYSQRNSALMSNFTEGLGKLNKNLIEARIRRDRFSEELAMLELQDYMKEHKAAQLYGRMFAISMIQGSIFLTYFLALRGMSYAPVMSMTQSGFLWITDMTLPDPAWILPLYSSLSVLIILELGLETGVSTDSMSKFKWVMRVMPIGMFFFIKDYPSVGDQDSRNFMRAGKDAAPPTFTYNPRDRFPEEFQKEKRKLRDLIGFKERKPKKMD
ncbi:conserved hypothetical protein [Trichinella spiralis]|uniref:hypothetical protein n=1 Tax=Trichinella spiralis TaxID=6334 RepID=UPI0001EFD73B|nr:conserved hypothetical protein [Trichinella spiralis]